MQNNIFIQHIIVGWTKASRGAPLSTLRNACPKAFPLTDSELEQLITEPSTSVILMFEGTQFHPYQRVDSGHSNAWPIKVKQRKKRGTVIRYKYSASLGAPTRISRPPIECPLLMESLLCVEFNNRDGYYTIEGDWRYYLHTFNIVHTKRPLTTMFMAKPTKIISDLEDLW